MQGLAIVHLDTIATDNDQDQGRNSVTKDAGSGGVDELKDNIEASVTKDDEGAGSVDDHEL